jgi:hypothetical protein
VQQAVQARKDLTAARLTTARQLTQLVLVEEAEALSLVEVQVQV